MRTAIVWVLLVGSATAVFGQAFTPQVDFSNNRAFARVADRDVYYDGATPLVGTQYLAQLYYGRDAGSLQPVTAAPATFRPTGTTQPAAGTWIGGTRVLTGFNAGEVAVLQVRVWDSTTGADFASASLKTQSATFTYSVPPAGALPSAYWLENLNGFFPLIIPEPSTIGLGVIGVVALLMVYRRSRDRVGQSRQYQNQTRERESL